MGVGAGVGARVSMGVRVGAQARNASPPDSIV
jgi:hypothetical protein